MLRDGRGVTIRLTLLVGLVVAAFSYLGLRFWNGQGGSVPEASWGGLTVLVFMACGVLFAGMPVRRFLRGKATKTLNPIRAMRTLVLAQACALTGALVAGWYVAQVLVMVPILDVSSRRTVALRLTALAAGGVLMVVAGLLTQAMCRVNGDGRGSKGEPNGDRDGDDGQESGAS
jgi:peptidoglycan/LPS O-acetylase OafA/YrhL